MQKWGKDARGKARFRCKSCGVSRIRKRPDLDKKYKKQLFVNWLLGKDSLTEIASKHQVTQRTLWNWFSPFWREEPRPKDVDFRSRVLIIDGKYVEKMQQYSLQPQRRVSFHGTLLREKTTPVGIPFWVA